MKYDLRLRMLMARWPQTKSSYYQFSYKVIDPVLPKCSAIQSLLGKYAEMILCLIFFKFCDLNK